MNFFKSFGLVFITDGINMIISTELYFILDFVWGDVDQDLDVAESFLWKIVVIVFNLVSPNLLLKGIYGILLFFLLQKINSTDTEHSDTWVMIPFKIFTILPSSFTLVFDDSKNIFKTNTTLWGYLVIRFLLSRGFVGCAKFEYSGGKCNAIILWI